MLVRFTAIVGRLPGMGDRGTFTQEVTVESRDEAVTRYQAFLDGLGDRYDDDFVSGQGWDIVSPETPQSLS